MRQAGPRLIAGGLMLIRSGSTPHTDPPAILALDPGGYPRRWIGLEEAATCYVRGAVAWDLGEHAFVLRGGVNRASGHRSELTLRSIVALRGDTVVRAPRERVGRGSRNAFCPGPTCLRLLRGAVSTG